MAHYLKKGLKILLLVFFFVLISKILWYFSESYFANIKKGDFQTLWVESDGKTDTIQIYQKQPLVVHNQRVNISGNSSNSKEVELYVNERKREHTNLQSDGKFNFSNVHLFRGLNKIHVKRSAAEYFFPEEYSVVFQEKPPEAPIILSYLYDSALSIISMIGVGEPDYTYCLKFASHLDSVRCDKRGTFSVSLHTTNNDTVGTFLSNIGNDTLSKIQISYQRGQYLIVLPVTLSRTIELIVDSSLSNMELKTTVYRLPVASALYENLASGNMNGSDFVEATFGQIDIATNPLSGFPVRTLPPKIKVSHKYADITLQANWNFSEGVKLSTIIFYPRFGFFMLDSLIFQIPKQIEYSLTTVPDTFAGDRKIWIGPRANFESFECSFGKEMDLMEQLKAGSEEKIQIPKNVIDLIRKLPEKVFDRKIKVEQMLDDALRSIFCAIPLIWCLLLIYRRNERLGRFQKTLLGTFVLLTFFHFFYPVLLVVTDMSCLIPCPDWWRKIESNLHFVYWYGPSSEDIGKFLIVGIILFNPLALALVAPKEAVPAKSSIVFKLFSALGMFALSLWFGYMLTEHFYVQERLPFFLDINYYICLCVITIILFIILYLLAMALRTIISSTLHFKLPRSKIYIALLVMIALPIVFDVLTSLMDDRLFIKPSLLWSITLSCFGAILLYSIMNVVFRLFLKPVRISKIWVNVLVVLGFALMAFPKLDFFNAAPSFVNYSFLSIFINITVTIFPFIVLFAVVTMLYEDSTVLGFKLDRVSRDWGLLLLSFFIVQRGFGDGFNWMYIPISMILAYFLSRQYLFMDPESAFESLKKNENPLQDRKSSIQKVISYLVFNRQFKDLKKVLDKKFTENTIEHTEWEKKTAENNSLLSDKRNLAKHDNIPLENVIFSHSIEASPWDNALLAMKVGTWLAIFWIFVFIRDFRTWEIYQLYPIFDLTSSYLYRILVWFIIAFVFGYYYHMLRGNTGIQKAVWFSLIVIMARIGPGIFFTDKIDQILFLLIWGIEVFAYCMFIGFFAFDLRILRKNGFEWRDVGVIYSLTSLSTFGSGLLAALLGILSGQLQALFKQLLGFIFDLK